jgi:hypothetical protein
MKILNQQSRDHNDRERSEADVPRGSLGVTVSGAGAPYGYRKGGAVGALKTVPKVPPLVLRVSRKGGDSQDQHMGV